MTEKVKAKAKGKGKGRGSKGVCVVDDDDDEQKSVRCSCRGLLVRCCLWRIYIHILEVYPYICATTLGFHYCSTILVTFT